MTTVANPSPVVALTLGDPAGIGPELIARLLATPGICAHANLVLVGDSWVWREGQRIAGLSVALQPQPSLDAVRTRADRQQPAFVESATIAAQQVVCGQASAACGAAALQALDICLAAARAGALDAICFAPLNKQAMKLAGLRHEDELHHFAERLGVRDFFCEFNTLGDLWTARVSSHIPLRDAAQAVTGARIVAAARLIDRALRASGHARPCVAVAALNPHGGEGGSCGREELDIIAPAVRQLQAEGLAVEGPFPADTIFLKARDGAYQAVVTMYHDQGQIALKLLGFHRGVTVHGGLPLPITTPAHGTAFDIAGSGRADARAMEQALRIAVRMGASRLAGAA